MSEVLKELQHLQLDVYGTFTPSDAPREDDDEDPRRDDMRNLLSKSLSCSSFGFSTQSDASGIQMSQFTRPASFK